MDDEQVETPLEKRLRSLLERRRTNSTLRNLTINSEQIDFSSNDFLSLSTCRVLKEAYLKELKDSNLPLGSGGSRLLDGNSIYAENLEKEIAEFHRAEAGLLFNSGFDANAGFFACVPQPKDIIIYDELIHASVHDGMRLSRALKSISFKHNSVDHLRTILQSLLEERDSLRKGKSHVIIAVEAIYSMDGDLAPLKDIINLVDEILPEGTGYVVVDEAHSTGVLGPQGRGLVCELGLEDRIFARLHTFGKSLACSGAIILGSLTLRDYLINYARPLIYTTFLSYPALSAIKASYSLLRSGHTVQLAAHLRTLIQSMYLLLHNTYSSSSSFRSFLRIPTECPRSPIFSIQLEEPKSLAKSLQEQGMMVRAVVPPTVPEGTSRVRVCLHAGNTLQGIKRLVSAMEEWCTQRTMQKQAEDEGQLGSEKENRFAVTARL